MAFYFIWVTEWIMKRHIHFPAGKFMCALSPRSDYGLRLCICLSHSPFILLEYTGGLSPTTAPDLAVLGAVQGRFEDLTSFSLCKCCGAIVLGTERHSFYPQGSNHPRRGCHLLFSVVSWRDRRRIRAAQEINHSHSFASVPPLSSLHSKAFLQSHTIFTSLSSWLSLDLGNTAPSAMGGVRVSGQPLLVWNEAVLSFHLQSQLNASSLVWAAMIAGWGHLVSSGEG